MLTGALVNLAAVCPDETPSPTLSRLLLRSLFATITNVDFNPQTLQAHIDEVHALLKTYGGSPAQDFSLQEIWHAQEDIRSLKSLLLFGIRGMSAYAYHALMLGRSNAEVNSFLCKGLAALQASLSVEELLPLVMEAGKVNLTCMAMLDEANTGTYGKPEPATVSLTIEKGPFIVVTGHDLKDLELLLKQTEGTGVSVYTHGEMLPAHAYPELKKYPHLKGNFGTAWQNQQKEFDAIPGALLFTTNCLMPPRPSYADRVFTTEAVSYQGTVHIAVSYTHLTLPTKRRV